MIGNGGNRKTLIRELPEGEMGLDDHKWVEVALLVLVLDLELIEDEDIPLVDGVLDGAVGAFGDSVLRLKLERMPWKSLRLKMNEVDDGLKVRMERHFIKRKWYRSGMG
ncbi:hypothetical protein Tco_0021403 [Tanacetum coccineum]